MKESESRSAASEVNMIQQETMLAGFKSPWRKRKAKSLGRFTHHI